MTPDRCMNEAQQRYIDAYFLPPSPGIGTLGRGVLWLAIFLQSGQQYWQMLPLDTLGSEILLSGVSCMRATRISLISDMLIADGLLTARRCKRYQLG
jgi:4-alpha-glucanotransferase